MKPLRTAWFLAALLGLFSAAPLVSAGMPDEALLRVERARIDVMARAAPAVVAIFAPGALGGGSGVLISPDGYAVSNFHVTQDAAPAMKCGLPDGNVYDAVIVGIDPTGDVALIKLLGRNDFPCAVWGDSLAAQPGQEVFAMGNPFLLASDFQPTTTLGVISAIERYQDPAGTILEYTDCLQIDASINPGNSGGPLFDAGGRLIGINGRASFEKRGRVNVGLAYAISAHQVQNFTGALRSGRIVDHASLGAVVSTDGEGRVVVSDVLQTSDAYRRGIRYGDEVLSLAGRPVRSVNGLKNILGTLPAGWRVPLVVRREEESTTRLVRLPTLHREGELEELLSAAPSAEIVPPHKDEPAPRQVPDDAEPEPPGQPELPESLRRLLPAAAPALPEAVRPWYAKRSGFANYHFNRLELGRVYEALQARGRYAAATGAWTLTGELVGGAPVQFVVDDNGAQARLPSGLTELTVSGDLSESLQPTGSGGLLAALHVWRRLLAHPLEEHLVLHYEGTAPLVGHDALVDVLAGAHAGVRFRLYADPATGDMLALEMFPTSDSDPCELYFRDAKQQGERMLPQTLEVWHGDRQFGEVRLTAWDLSAEPAR